MSKKQTVPITVAINAASAPARVAELVRPVLTAHRRKFDVGGPLGYRDISEIEEFYGSDPESGELIFPAGLVPRVVQQLEQRGFLIQVREDGDSRDLLRAHLANATMQTDCDPAFCDVLMSNTQGQILVSERGEAFDIMESICRIWGPDCSQVQPPNLQILVRDRQRDADREFCHHNQAIPDNLQILVRDAQRQQAVYRELSDRLDTPVAMEPNHGAGCVVVCLPHHYGPARLWQVVIFDGSQPLLAGQNFELACRRPRRFKYCIRPYREVLDDSMEMRVAAICGPVINPLACEPAEVTVAFVQAPHIHAPRSKLSPLERKRQTLWHNQARNDTIATLARACVDGDVAALWEHGVFLDMDEQAVCELLPGRDVTVVVETAEHGRQLAKLLPS